jgi:RNA polymerase sigma-70 factor (ECF subfamily)
MSFAPETRASLLARLRCRHDEEAWAEFVEIYEPMVYRLARQRGLQDADAAELTQEVFVAVASAIDRWQPDPARAKFRTWLFRVARNLIHDSLAARARRPQASGDTAVRALADERAAPSAEESALFEQESRRRLFHWAAERIRGEFHDATWNAFWLTAVEGKETRQAAETLGMTIGAVYTARSRILARLRQIIEQVEGGQ